MEKCPMSGQRSTRWPGRDQCEHCGRVVWTKKDDTYQAHTMPTSLDDDTDAIEGPPSRLEDR